MKSLDLNLGQKITVVVMLAVAAAMAYAYATGQLTSFDFATSGVVR